MGRKAFLLSCTTSSLTHSILCRLANISPLPFKPGLTPPMLIQDHMYCGKSLPRIFFFLFRKEIGFALSRGEQTHISPLPQLMQSIMHLRKLQRQAQQEGVPSPPRLFCCHSLPAAALPHPAPLFLPSKSVRTSGQKSLLFWPYNTEHCNSSCQQEPDFL